MKITICTVASDTDMGTESHVFASEAEAIQWLWDEIVEDRVCDEDRERDQAQWDNGEMYEVIQRYSDYLDTYSHETHEIDVPDHLAFDRLLAIADDDECDMLDALIKRREQIDQEITS